MGELLAELRGAKIVKGPPCSIGATLAALDPTDASDLADALADEAIAATVIARVMTARGYKLGNQAVGRHRRGDCNCG